MKENYPNNGYGQNQPYMQSNLPQNMPYNKQEILRRSRQESKYKNDEMEQSAIDRGGLIAAITATIVSMLLGFVEFITEGRFPLDSLIILEYTYSVLYIYSFYKTKRSAFLVFGIILAVSAVFCMGAFVFDIFVRLSLK